jgi:hypothetical protein
MVKGWYANIALAVNLLFLLESSLGAVLTLPGIAGIVLTMGTAVILLLSMKEPKKNYEMVNHWMK